MVLDQVLRSVGGVFDPALDVPVLEPVGRADELTEAARFLIDIVTGRFLAPAWVHPPRDLAAARRVADQLRKEGRDLRAIARRLSDLGYLTRSRRGTWQPGAVAHLLDQASPDHSTE